ncbi:hypothetical protein ACWGVR_27640 [Streptomyces xanthophaeus]
MTTGDQGNERAPQAYVSDAHDVPVSEAYRELLWSRGVVTSRGRGKSALLGELLKWTNRLGRAEDALRSAVVAGFAQDAVARLLGEAFGLGSDPQQAGRPWPWNCYPGARARKKTDAPEVFGAYALSAGPRPLAVAGDDEAAAVVHKALDSILVEAQASGAAAYRRGIEALADLIAVWRDGLLRVIQQRLLPVAYEYADHVPPLACSPCGVIRMASPEVPRGPQLDLHSNTFSPFWVLAA